MKAHVIESEDPLREGADITALCGALVSKAVFAYMWNSSIAPEFVAALTTLNTCRSCYRQFLSKRYIYGILPGAEIRPEHEEEVAA